MQTVIITGVNGFVGKHLVRELHSQKVNIIGIGREPSTSSDIANLLSEYWVCDLTNHIEVNNYPWEKADSIISLAGLAQVGASFNNPEFYKSLNVAVLANIYEYLSRGNLKTKVIAVSTGAVYDPFQPMPLNENSKLATQPSPYAESKMLMEKSVNAYREKGLDIVVVRPFNHIGPGQEPGFLVPDLYKRIVDAITTNKPLKVGNLETRRDYTDVRDVVKAYALLALTKDGQLHKSLYNVCSGTSLSGNQILEVFKKIVPESDQLVVEIDQSLIRPNDPVELIGDNQALKADTGWQPAIQYVQTIADFVSAQGV